MIKIINIEKLKDLEWERNKMNEEDAWRTWKKKKKREKVIKWKEMIKKR